MALTKERDQRHRYMVLLERRVELLLEQFAWLCLKGDAALVGPELLGFPEPPMPIVELLDDPRQPARASLRHDHAHLRMGFEDVVHIEFGVLEYAGGLAGDTVAGTAQKHRDVPRQDEPGVFEGLPHRFPGRVVELR